MSDSGTNFDEAANILVRAVEIARSHHHEMATLEHVLTALMEHPDVQKCLSSLSVDCADLQETMAAFMQGGFLMTKTGEPEQSISFQQLFHLAVGTSRFSSKRTVTSLDLLFHLSQFPHEDCYAVTALRNVNVTPSVLKRFMANAYGHAGAAANGRTHEMNGEFGPGDAEPQNTNDAIRLLKKYCVNFNENAAEGRIDPLIGRAAEVDQITQIIARRTKNNVCLVGEPGVGKTAIPEGLAANIISKNVPDILLNSTVWALDVGSLVAGTRFRGDFEERMKLVLKALEMLDGSILFIDEIHTIMDAGSGAKGSLDVANLLKPALSKGKLRCIGSTTLEEWRRHFEKDRALVRRFKRVVIDEPSPELAKDILRGLKVVYEGFHGVSYTDAAIDAAVDLTSKYVHDGKLPDKAIDVIDNAGARQRVTPVETRLTVIDVAQIEAEVSKVAQIPEQEIQANETDKLTHLEDDLRASVFGQNDAITALVDSVFVQRAGLRDPGKPAGSYLFAGPTGVGKTETAKQLAKTLGFELVRFDMSEYMEKHAVSKFIGSPPGYVGYGEGGAGNGLLINAIDTHPSCVLLLDEIEKAHEDIYNVLLQVMDAGRLTSSSGKTVNFRNVIIIMTTNAGVAKTEQKPIGFGSPDVSPLDERVIERTFPPEFRNRLDKIIYFDRLKRPQMLLIVDKFLAHLGRLAADRGVTVVVEPSAKEWLADRGYDPVFGARPLDRMITEHLKKPLSRLMLTGGLSQRGVARVWVQDNRIAVEAVTETLTAD